MRFQNILTAALLIFGFTNAEDCNSRFSPEELNEINIISNEIDVSACIAGDVYDYMNKAHKFNILNNLTEEECHIGCLNAAMNLNGIDEVTSAALVNICDGKCILENIPEPHAEPEGVNIEKRETCDPISQANVSVSDDDYRNGYKQYEDKGTKKTALSHVNGCGPKQAVFGIDNNTLKKIPLLLDGTFEPACNMHDICYICQKGKSTCDTRFKNGMNDTCDRAFPSSSHFIKNAGCKVQAGLFYKAVNLAGDNAYNNTPVNPGSTCAACGVSVIKNTLVSTPFFKK